MGLKLDDSIITKQAKEYPSPDFYSPKFDFIKKKDGVFSIGRA